MSVDLEKINELAKGGENSFGGEVPANIVSLASLLDGFPDPAIVIADDYKIIAANDD